MLTTVSIYPMQIIAEQLHRIERWPLIVFTVQVIYAIHYFNVNSYCDVLHSFVMWKY